MGQRTLPSCPNCGQQAHSPFTPGDVSLCLRCAQWHVATGGTLRRPTATEATIIAADWGCRIAAALAARHHAALTL
jgi:hypothetical protein